MTEKSHIHKFFTISNLIEGVDNNDEVIAHTEFLLSTFDMSDEKVMYLFHSKMNFLNDYCKAGELRTYDVFVGGRKCLAHEHIEGALTSLFSVQPKTYKEIKRWHVRFEKIHPFGDGNGRTGRLLFIRHLMYNNLSIPAFLLTRNNFESNRNQYYRWFK